MLVTLTKMRRAETKPVMWTLDAETDRLVIKTDSPPYSMCMHHLLPCHGGAHVAYRPGETMAGLSKLVRYVRWQSRCLTTQEALTHDIATGLADELDARGVLVEVTATRLSAQMCGVETTTDTTTSECIGTATDVDREKFH